MTNLRKKKPDPLDGDAALKSNANVVKLKKMALQSVSGFKKRSKAREKDG